MRDDRLGAGRAMAAMASLFGAPFVAAKIALTGFTSALLIFMRFPGEPPPAARASRVTGGRHRPR